VSGVELAVYAVAHCSATWKRRRRRLAGVPFAIVSGGIACVVAAAVFALRVRSFATYVRPSTSKKPVG